MANTYRLLLCLVLTTCVSATAVPAQQPDGQTQTPPRRQRAMVPRRTGAVVVQQPGGKTGGKTGGDIGGKTGGKQGSTLPPRTQRPPRTNGGSSGGDDVHPNPPPKNPETGGDGHDTPPPYPPRDPRPERPHRPRWPGGIVINIGGGGQQDPRDGKKDDKKKDDPVANDVPRPLKYDKGAYRRLSDSLLARGRVDAALRMISLLKEQEYYEYTGSFGNAIASLPEPPDYTALAVRVVAKDKKKDKVDDADKDKKKDKKDKDGASWEDGLEARADEVLALEREAAALRAVPAASRTADQQQRLAKLESDLDAATADLDALTDALARDLGRKDPRVKNLRAAEKLADTLVQLPPGTVAIYTLTSEERFWTIVVSPLGRTAYATPIRSDDLARKVHDFRSVLVNPKQDPAPLARELYDIVLGRAQTDPAFATARTLLWSFDGVLRYVPAAALNNGQSYLVERYRNVVFNRASVDSLLDAPSSQLSGIGLGVARQIAPYQPLPAVEEELDGIFASGGSGPLPGKVLLDASFTEPALEQALQGGNPVVHIATHFQLSPSDADNSLLLLGDGKLLNVGEIRQIKGGFRGVDLLTLSACDTAASGPTADGKEVECFGTIAQEEGAKSVIASLWPVSDRSTSLLMQTFYRLRATNPTATKAELFREAQIALVKGTVAIPPSSGASRILVHAEAPTVAGQPAYTPDPNAPFAHPYYWAPFLMIGNFR